MRLLVLFLLIGCSSTVYPRHALVAERLIPRKGFTGLTNRVCLEYKGDECVRDDIKEYLFSDESFRHTANALGIICRVAHKRYKVCIDKPGLCRFRYDGWFNERIIEEYIPQDRYEFLLDA